MHRYPSLSTVQLSGLIRDGVDNAKLIIIKKERFAQSACLFRSWVPGSWTRMDRDAIAKLPICCMRCIVKPSRKNPLAAALRYLRANARAIV